MPIDEDVFWRFNSFTAFEMTDARDGLVYIIGYLPELLLTVLTISQAGSF